MNTEQTCSKSDETIRRLGDPIHRSKNVIVIDPSRDPRWDSFVEKHSFGWICHLSGWKKVLEQTFPQMRGHYLALLSGNGTQICAGLTVFEINSWLTGRKLVSIPFATLSDPLISTSEDMGLLLNAAFDLAAERKICHVEIRTFRAAPLIHDSRLTERSDYRLHFLTLDEGMDKLKRRFHPTSVRQCIDHAIKSDLIVEEINNHNALFEFYNLYCLTRKRLGLPWQPFAFFENLWDVFVSTKKMLVLLARHRGLAVAGLINFRFNGRVSYETVGSDMRYRHLRAEHLLVWEAIKLAHRDGYTIFDFGRTSVLNRGLMTFKRRWGTEVADLHQFYFPKEHCQNLRSKESSLQYRLMRNIIRSAPSGIANQISMFCYKHLG